MTRNIFEDDRGWMEKQPFMRPWDEGCSKLDSTINKWMDEMANEVFKSATVDRGPMRERIWSCWSYHWHEDVKLCDGSEVDPLKVSDELRGQVSSRGRKPGEDLIRDCIVVEAAHQGDEIAIECLNAYLDRAGLRQAAKFEPFVMQLDWKEELLFSLVFDPTKAGIAKFKAKGSLQAYLNMIVGRHLILISQRHRKDIDLLQKKVRENERNDISETTDGPADNLETAECDELLAKLKCEELLAGLIGNVLSEAIDDEKQSEERVVLFHKMIHKRSNTDIGKMLRKHKAQVGRILNRLYQRINDRIEEIGQDSPNRTAYGTCVELVFSGDCGSGSLQGLLKKITDELKNMMNEEGE